ncbi:MAG: FAD-binding oxidoreductase [Pseudomonadota bacterium]
MADVTVYGAGVFGLAIAWSLVRKGARVRMIDPRGVGSGASGGPVGALAPHTPDGWNPKKATQFESLKMAPSFWAEVEAASGETTGFRRSGRLQPLADARAVELAMHRAGAACETWGSYAEWNVIDESAAGPWRPISPTGRFVHDTLSAQIEPQSACRALASALRTHGTEVLAEGDEAGLSIWATGWEGLAKLTEATGRRMGVGVKGQALRLVCDAPADAPQIFAGGLHIISHGDGTIAIGSTTERVFEDPYAVDEAGRDLAAAAASHFPELEEARIVDHWAGVRPRAISRAPLLGAWPGRPGHFVANGGFKIGFGMAPWVGRAMAELVLDGTDRIPDAFRLV